METDRPILGQNSLTSIASEVSLWENLINWSSAGARSREESSQETNLFVLFNHVYSIRNNLSVKKKGDRGCKKRKNPLLLFSVTGLARNKSMNKDHVTHWRLRIED